mmetsp:Transcript_9785/g.29743  ORF Transcript_9785/g.29743 Transcript_9785/m.29743 type:complete len:234 (+) Transcript_9785:3483-4184(+)
MTSSMASISYFVGVTHCLSFFSERCFSEYRFFPPPAYLAALSSSVELADSPHLCRTMSCQRFGFMYITSRSRLLSISTCTRSFAVRLTRQRQMMSSGNRSMDSSPQLSCSIAWSSRCGSECTSDISMLTLEGPASAGGAGDMIRNCSIRGHAAKRVRSNVLLRYRDLGARSGPPCRRKRRLRTETRYNTPEAVLAVRSLRAVSLDLTSALCNRGVEEVQTAVRRARSHFLAKP